MGIGMTVVEGLTRAMRGDVSACRSEMGGLRVDVHLRPAVVPADTAAGSANGANAGGQNDAGAAEVHRTGATTR
jgi:hypothetical protein